MDYIPKFYLDEVIRGTSHTLHPAFVVNGKELDGIYVSKIQNVVIDGRAHPLPGRDPAVHKEKGRGSMFTGFTPETVDFLWGIRMNNNRDWFLAHKQDYVNHLYEPMKALGKDLYGILSDRPGNLLKVSRIYRDARMHHPLPYKESLWICIRKDVDWWAQHPCLFFEIRPEKVSYGFFLWQPTTAAMEAFRKHIGENPGEFLTLIRRTEKQTGIPVTAETYKRPKIAPDAVLAPYFAWRGCIECTVEEEVSPALFGPALGQRAAALLEKLIPLYEYFYRFTL